MSARFTILVVTYNPVWEKLRLTLDSCLKQNFTDYEIIISDDGSADNLKDTIVSYFADNNFTNYRLVMNEKNAGTVINHIRGLEFATGKYVKGISPGDLFYNESSIKNMYDFMEEHSYENCFGLLRAYYITEDGGMSTRRYPHPFDLIAYRKYDYKKIQRNLILYSDHVCGAAMCFTTEFLKEYLNKITDTVVYEEDIMQVYAAVENRTFNLFDDYFIWYEDNTGISRQKHSPFVALLEKDVHNFYQMMFKLFPENRWLNKRKSLLGFYKIKNLYLRTALRFFKNPGLSLYMLEHFKQIALKSNEIKNPPKGFLDDPGFLK